MSDRKALPIPAVIVRASAAAAVAALIGWTAPSAHAAETSNRIAANRIAGNRLAGNRLAGNRLAGNKLTASRLEANPDTAEMLGTADGREVYSYMMSCALPAGKIIEATIPNAPDIAPPDALYTCKNERCSFPGSVGLAEHWIDRSLDPKGQRWVTACLLARVNLYGITQIISLRGVAPQLSANTDEAELYSLQEGAFYGNIFNDPYEPLDWNACRGKDQAAGETGGLELRDCAEPDPNDPTHTKCGFKYSGDCGNYTHSAAQPHACRSFDTDEGTYGECIAREDNGQGPSLKIYREVITTYVKH